jgi:hypothetical protein
MLRRPQPGLALQFLREFTVNTLGKKPVLKEAYAS